MNNTDKRISYLDIARGMAMLAVVWGHIMLSGWSNVLVYAFDIPLFLFLSGMMFKTDRIKGFPGLFKRIISKLLIPYALFGVGTWMVWIVYQNYMGRDTESYLDPLKQLVIAYGSSDYLVHNPALWFVTCLAVVQIVYYIFTRYFSEKICVVLCIFCGITGFIMVEKNLVEIPWNFEAAMSAMPLFLAGNLFVRHCGYSWLPDYYERNRKALILITAAVSVLFTAGALWNGAITLGSNNLGRNAVILYIVGALGIIAVLGIAVMIEKNFSEKSYGWLKWIGENSFFFMAVHIPVKRFVITWLAEMSDVSRIYVQNTEIYSFMAFIISLPVTAVIVWVLNIIVDKYSTYIKKEKSYE